MGIRARNQREEVGAMSSKLMQALGWVIVGMLLMAIMV